MTEYLVDRDQASHRGIRRPRLPRSTPYEYVKPRLSHPVVQYYNWILLIGLFSWLCSFMTLCAVLDMVPNRNLMSHGNQARKGPDSKCLLSGIHGVRFKKGYWSSKYSKHRNKSLRGYRSL